jgi:hypothetical protein
MADLGLNSLWSDVKKKDPAAEEAIKGPDYSYADNVPKPSGPGGLGVGTDGSFSQLGTNLGAVGTYVDTLVGTREMGDQYLVNTGGTCTAPDGSIQARFNYISNKQAGLVEGVLGDIGGLNPTYLINSLTASASPACKCYKCDVTSGDGANWLTPDLSPDFDAAKCKVVDSSKCPKVESTEKFSNETLVPTLIAGIALCSVLLLRK